MGMNLVVVDFPSGVLPHPEALFAAWSAALGIEVAFEIEHVVPPHQARTREPVQGGPPTRMAIMGPEWLNALLDERLLHLADRVEIYAGLGERTMWLAMSLAAVLEDLGGGCRGCRGQDSAPWFRGSSTTTGTIQQAVRSSCWNGTATRTTCLTRWSSTARF